ADGGELLLDAFEDGDGAGLDLIALDRGRGMTDIERCFVDGYSTGGTPGNGLGAVRRASHRVDVWSAPGPGTVMLAGIGTARAGGTVAPSAFEWGAVSVPLAGEEVCGDAWAAGVAVDGVSFMVVDGLGHGPHAATAAQGAIKVFAERGGSEPPAALLQRMHR